MKKLLILTSFILLTNFTYAKSIHHKCSNCHGNNGEMSALGKTKPIAGMSKKDLLKDMNLYKEGKLNKYGFGGLMRQQMYLVNEDEFDSIADAISKFKTNKKGED